MNTNSQAVIYWIRLSEHTDPFTQGYIGVSKRFEKRILDHEKFIKENKHKNPHLVNSTKKYGWDNLIKEIIFIGDEIICYEKEIEYRPVKTIGWNIAPGGHRGPGWPLGKPKDPKSVKLQQLTMAPKLAEISKRNMEKRRLYLDQRERKRIEKELEIENNRKKQILKREQRKEKLANVKPKKFNRISRNTLDLSKRPFCPKCNKHRCSINYWKGDIPHFRNICNDCGKKTARSKTKIANWEKAGYKKKNKCDLCGFVPIYPSQITVFYIDGNLNNASFNNLRSICLNCIEVVKKKEVNWKRGDLQVD